MAEEKKRPSNNNNNNNNIDNSTVCIQPTTGGQIEMKVPKGCTVACLKRALSKRIKVPKERIVLLHKNKQLVDGTLEGNSVVEGSKLTLLPSVETGILTRRQELGVMQALETLNDGQVDSFLTGKSPLNLTMRLGDHMMFIQLQLSTNTPPSNGATLSTPSPIPTPPTTPTTPSTPLQFPTPLSEGSTPPSPPPSPRLTVAPPAPRVPVSEQQQQQPTSEAAAGGPPSNNKVLAEASRNLTHTLRHLSSAALNQKMNESCDGRCKSRRQGGAVIESMFHHGRGVYSGTFSGTLNPSLQDTDGRPRKDITTIIHILNDLLGASSHCRPSAQCLCSPGGVNLTVAPAAATKTTTTTTATVTATTPLNSNATTLPPTSSSHSDVNMTDVNENEGESKQEENKVLRKKVKHIQSMLDERRRERKARRPSPYYTRSSVIQEVKTNNDQQKMMTGTASPCESTKMAESFSSSETAVA